MTEPQVVIFEDQAHRRRKLQLHSVDGQLRVNLVTALTNYEAVSFSRVADGLILEKYRDSEFSNQSFRPGEVVSIEAVRRSNTDSTQNIVKALLEELDKRELFSSVTVDAVVKGVVEQLSVRPEQMMRTQYQDDTAQPMQQDATPQQLTAAQVDLNHPTTDAQALVVQQPAQLGPMQLSMTPAATASPTVSEVNASGKKRRYCGACQNHNVKTPVTFQHQQSCQWRACPCNLCLKKRNISQAQAHKRHAAKAAASNVSGGQVESVQQVQQQPSSPLPPGVPVAPASPGQLSLPVPETAGV
jgi:hypothetical protein